MCVCVCVRVCSTCMCAHVRGVCGRVDTSRVGRNSVAVACCVLQCVAVRCCSVLTRHVLDATHNVVVCCSVLQCVVVSCSVLQCVDTTHVIRNTLHCSLLQYVAVFCSVLQCVAACCSVLQCVAVCCSVLTRHMLYATPCIAACCSILQYVAACSVRRSVLQCVDTTSARHAGVLAQKKAYYIAMTFAYGPWPFNARHYSFICVWSIRGKREESEIERESKHIETDRVKKGRDRPRERERWLIYVCMICVTGHRTLLLHIRHDSFMWDMTHLCVYDLCYRT